MRAIHQLLPALHQGDAVGNEARLLQAWFRERGLRSEIFAGALDQRLPGQARALTEAASQDGSDVMWLFHFGPDSPAGRCARERTGPLVLRYHNLTPPELLATHAPELARLCERGRREVAELATIARLGVGASEYNRRELEQRGYRATACVPLAVDLARLSQPGSPVLERLLKDGRRNLLVVGRVAPNKKLEDVIQAFAVLQKLFDRRCRLIVAGSWAGFESYRAALDRRVRELRVERVEFLGQVDDDELATCYAVSEALLCLSEHEGVGAPLLEAMARDLPVFAYDAGAVRETLDGAGVLLGQKAPELVAGALDRVLSDPWLRSLVIAGQREAIARRQQADLATAWIRTLSPLVESQA